MRLARRVVGTVFVLVVFVVGVGVGVNHLLVVVFVVVPLGQVQVHAQAHQVECVGPSAPADPQPGTRGECFAAVSEAGGSVTALGMSIRPSFSSVGWPSDNDRLLANLLLGGDAEGLPIPHGTTRLIPAVLS